MNLDTILQHMDKNKSRYFSLASYSLVMSENFVVLQLDTVNNHLRPLFEVVKAKGF